MSMYQDLDLIPLKRLREEVIMFSGTSHLELAQGIAEILQLELGIRDIEKFFNGETKIQLIDNVRMMDVVFIQTCTEIGNDSVNDILWELGLMIDAAVRASANRITVVMPCYGYGQQEKKTDGREPISAKFVANFLKMAGTTHIITIDLHSGSIQGFFDGPVDNLFANKWLYQALKHFLKNNILEKNFVVLSPDSGGVARARWLAGYSNLGFALGLKIRKGKDKPEVQTITGDIKGMKCITPDDKMSSGGTISDLSELAVTEYGATEIIPLVTHPSPRKEALEKVLDSDHIKIVVVANTVPIDSNIKIPPDKTLIVVDISPLLAFAIRASQTIKGSISKLFNFEPYELGLSYKVYTNEGIEKVIPSTEMSLAVN